MASIRGTLAAMHRPAASKAVAVEDVRSFVKSFQGNGTGRRGLLTVLMLSTSTMVSEASGSKTSLLQEYLKRSNENKAKNDKERLDEYYKRNYKDYFELIEGSAQGKKDEELSESEKAIREWLQKNRK